MSSFTEWLHARDDDRLVALLLARPDLAVPRPGSMLSLTARATNRTSLERALAGLDAFTLQVLETVVALAPLPTEHVDAARIASAVQGAPRATVDAAVDRAETLALLWQADDGDSAALRPAPGLTDLLGPYPAGLGPVTDPTSAAQIARRVRAATPPARPGPDRGAARTPPVDQEHPTGAGAALDPARLTPHRLADALAEAPPGARAILDALTWGPPAGRAPVDGPGALATTWLVERGLLVRSEGALVLLPREVGLALREGSTFAASADRAPDPQAPAYPMDRIDAEAIGTADAIVHQVAELLHLWAQHAPAPLKAGGLGVRDLRRLAAHLETGDEAAAFAVEIAAAAGLIMDDAELTPRLTPTPAADAWLAEDLAGRWAQLAHAWRGTSRTPWLVGSRDAHGTLHAPLAPDLHRPWVARLRTEVLGVLADHPGAALTADDVVAVLAWRTPRSAPPAHAIAELLAEAARLGVTGAGALSTAGLAVAHGADARAALDTVLPPAVGEILLQGDLTGIVPGRPTPELEHLLDTAAVVESRGGALTVRFTDRSITAALDAGMTGDEVLAALGAHAPTGVPQPLEYLVRDAARRHGRLRVGSASSYVRADDPALLAGLAEDPRLRRLGLRVLAPTVLIAQGSGPELLDALRERGLAPVAEGPDGVLLDPSARPQPTRSGSAPSRTAAAAARAQAARSEAPVAVETDDARRARVASLVARLRADEDATSGVSAGSTAGVPTGSTAGGRASEPQRAPVETRVSGRDGAGASTDSTAGSPGTAEPAQVLTRLREAIDAGTDLWIDVIDGAGRLDRRRLRPLTLEAGRLRARDVVRESELTVAVHRIARVEPVE